MGMVTFKRAYARTVVFSAPYPMASHCWSTSPPETPGHSQASLVQSLFGSLLLSSGSWCTPRFCLCPPRVLPQSCGSSVIISHWPSNSNSLGVLSPFTGSPGWEICGPRTFATVWEILWYNCSPVCGLSAQWFYGGAHMPPLPGLLQPESLSSQQATVDPCLHRRQTLKGRSGSVSCGVPGSWCE